MKNIALIFICVLTLGVCQTSQAQSRAEYTSLRYAVAFPMSDLKDYISKTSWRGVAFDYRYMIKPNIGMGLDVGWNVFYEKMDYGTYTDGTSSLSGTQFRYTNVMPIHAAVDYAHKVNDDFAVTAGLGIGTHWTVRDLDMGLFSWRQETWNFSLKPQIAAVWYPGNGPGVKMSFAYHEAFKTSQMDDQSYMVLSLGLIY